MTSKLQTITLRVPKAVAEAVEKAGNKAVADFLDSNYQSLFEGNQQDQETPALRTALMELANKIITKDRASTHGKAEDSFQIIASYWSVYLTKQFGFFANITKIDVAQLMVLFKVARIHNNPGHMDNWLDQLGYSALGGEIAIKESESVSINSNIGEEKK